MLDEQRSLESFGHRETTGLSVIAGIFTALFINLWVHDANDGELGYDTTLRYFGIFGVMVVWAGFLTTVPMYLLALLDNRKALRRYTAWQTERHENGTDV